MKQKLYLQTRRKATFLNIHFCSVFNPKFLHVMEIILGIDWIDDLEAQMFFIQYITNLKQKRSELVINQL